MAIVVVLLGLILLSLGIVLAFGAFGFYSGVDLLLSEPSLPFAAAGVAALSAGVLTIAVGVLIARVNRLARALDEPRAPTYEPAAPMPEPEPLAPVVEEVADTAAAATPVADEAVNENRAGHLPSLETPEAPPTLVGRYSAGGANYMIFSDGSIEAETSEGTFKFASMGEFKKHIAGKTA